MTKRDTRLKPRATAPASTMETRTQAAVTDAWMFFVVSGLALAVVAVILLRGAEPAAIAVIVFTLLAAGLVGLTAVGVLGPLVGLVREQGPSVGGRTRAALERDKALTLRAIKELEFDRAMDKVSEADFVEMRDRLRQRALRLMRQLEGGVVYQQMIERDLATRVGDVDHAVTAAPANDSCPACGTSNDPDARFCKSCGSNLEAARGGQG